MTIGRCLLLWPFVISVGGMGYPWLWIIHQGDATYVVSATLSDDAPMGYFTHQLPDSSSKELASHLRSEDIYYISGVPVQSNRNNLTKITTLAPIQQIVDHRHLYITSR